MPSRRMRSRLLGILLIGFLLVILAGAVAAAVLAHEIVLILFLAVLFAVFLGTSAEFLSDKLPLTRGWALALVTGLIVTFIVASGLLLGYRLEQQFAAAEEQLDAGLHELRDMIQERPALRSSIDSTPVLRELLVSGGSDKSKTDEAEEPSQTEQQDKQQETNAEEGASSASASDSETTASMSSNQGAQDQLQSKSSLLDATGGSIVPRATQSAVQVVGRVFRTSLGIIANSALIFFVGLFLASNPKTYRDGVVLLFPPRHRDRMREVLNQTADSLWRWLIGRFASMLITGVGAAIILWLLGVPMALTLGLITGLLTFVPNIGAAIALLLSILFALPEGISTALLVIPAYLVLQLFESYVVTPLIQRHQVGIPPALLLSTQAIMGVLFGFLGAAVASPLLAAAKVLVQQLYVRDFLESRSSSDESQQSANAT